MSDNPAQIIRGLAECPFFNLSGKTFWSIDIFKILVIWGAIIDLLHFIILAGIPSAPVAFFMLILFIIFSTLSVVTFSKTNLFVQSC
jgi:hypothetical protein